MKWTLAWLRKNGSPTFTFDQSVLFDSEWIHSTSQLLDVKQVRVFGNGEFQKDTDCLRLSFTVTGIMVVPCAYTLEPVDYPFTTEYEQEFAFRDATEDDTVEVIQGNVLDIARLVFELVRLEIPLRVVKEGATMKTSGDGWEVIAANQIKSEQSTSTIDPRFSKLKDYLKKQ